MGAAGEHCPHRHDVHLNHSYATPGVKTVTVAVTDSSAVTVADTAQVTVTANVAPVVNAGPDGPAVTGVAWHSSGTFTDELPDAATATVDYGDGAGPVPLALVEGTFTLSHVYTTAGAKTVTVKVTDSGTLFGTDTATVTVGAPPNVAPTVNAGPDASTRPVRRSPARAVQRRPPRVGDRDGRLRRRWRPGGPHPRRGRPSRSATSTPRRAAKTVTVKVTDAGTLTATDTATVTVTAAPPGAGRLDRQGLGRAQEDHQGQGLQGRSSR